MVYGLRNTGTRRDFVAIRYEKGNSGRGTSRRAGSGRGLERVGCAGEGRRGIAGMGTALVGLALSVQGGSFSSFPLLSSSFLRIHLHLFLLVHHLPRVNRFDQSHLAVILRQLLVFTTLHAPHFLPPSQSLVHFPLSLPQ